jgi:hypothetical protein
LKSEPLITSDDYDLLAFGKVQKPASPHNSVNDAHTVWQVELPSVLDLACHRVRPDGGALCGADPRKT